MPCSRMTWSLQPNEQFLQHQNPGTIAEVEEKRAMTVKIGREGMIIKILNEPIITTYLEGLVNKSMRIRAR